jgi:hypothetical protein
MKSIIINIDGSAMKFSKTGYIQYLKDIIKEKPMPLDCYNAKDLGCIKNVRLDREDDLRYELKTMLKREE